MKQGSVTYRQGKLAAAIAACGARFQHDGKARFWLFTSVQLANVDRSADLVCLKEPPCHWLKQSGGLIGQCKDTVRLAMYRPCTRNLFDFSRGAQKFYFARDIFAFLIASIKEYLSPLVPSFMLSALLKHSLQIDCARLHSLPRKIIRKKSSMTKRPACAAHRQRVAFIKHGRGLGA